MSVSKEDVKRMRNQIHLAVACGMDTEADRIALWLADDNDRLRSERDEVVALLESYGHDLNWTAKMDALLAKLRTP